MTGPIFFRELAVAPRRSRLYLYRAVYAAALLVVVCTAWLVLAGTQIVVNVGDMARFGGILFQKILAPLQLAIVVFLSAIGSASAVSQEKDRRTLLLLLLTRLTNSELVLGKLFSSMLNVVNMLLAGLPVFMLIVLFGGVSPYQVMRVFAVTASTALLAGSLGTLLGFWREKTFQTLSITALVVVAWTGLWQTLHWVLKDALWFQLFDTTWAGALSPVEALGLAAEPALNQAPITVQSGVAVYLVASITMIVVLNSIGIIRVRVWNPSREVRPGQHTESDASIWGAEHDLASPDGAAGRAESAERARTQHVDSIGRAKTEHGSSRRVWDNPIIWREICTRAYGKKLIVIRLAYLLMAVLAGWMLHFALQTSTTAGSSGLAAVVPAAVTPLAPFFLISVVIINALAVTSITNERDGLALDLLLVTDISPREFVFGKIGGIMWVTKEMVLAPLALCLFLWWRGGISPTDVSFVMCALTIMYFFATMLGIHCGMTYANSRTAIGVSLGSVFFLFLGVVTCILVMISFSGSFQRQLPAFLAFSLGGSVGLYVALGMRNPSRAIFCAALFLPIGTFHAITSFLIGQNGNTFLVITAIYGFTTAAMLMPAIGEFDFAVSRSKTAD